MPRTSEHSLSRSVWHTQVTRGPCSTICLCHPSVARPARFGKFLVAHQQHFHMSLTKSLKFSTFLHCLQTCFCRVHTKTCQRSYGHLSSPQSRRSCEKRHHSAAPVMTAFPGLPGDELAVPIKLKRNSGAAPMQWLTMLYETPGRSQVRAIKGGAMFHCSVISPGH